MLLRGNDGVVDWIGLGKDANATDFLFGSGYVLVAFLEGDLVQGRGWLTQQQLLDAIAVGQFTPGPVLSTATFIGYQILGVSGAIVATLAIFFPSFIFVLLLNPLIPKLRESAWAAAFLDAINASAVALMVAVIFNLALATYSGHFLKCVGQKLTRLGDQCLLRQHNLVLIHDFPYLDIFFEGTSPPPVNFTGRSR